MKAQVFSIELPAPIAAYWTAANAGLGAAAAACFAPEAVVRDESHVYRGRAAIAAWIEETTRKYQSVVEPLRCATEAGRHGVIGKVSGSFPGSPVELEFEFTVADGKIVQLEIK